MIPFLICTSALAGTVLVDAQVATAVHLDGQPVVQTYGPAKVTLPAIEGGLKTFVIYREGKAHPMKVEVPVEGTVRLNIGKELVETDIPPDKKDNRVTGIPTVELKAAHGHKFMILIDGERLTLLTHHQPIRLEELGVGEHTFEARSKDNLTVWLRGSLDLQAGDEVSLTIAEGKMPEVFGRKAAWIPSS